MRLVQGLRILVIADVLKRENLFTGHEFWGKSLGLCELQFICIVN